MLRWTWATGVLALLLAIADFLHGQHNGDSHRAMIHISEFVAFFAFLCLLQVWSFRLSKRITTNTWVSISFVAFFTGFLGTLFFAMSGGSPHGDGGPIAFSFLLIATIASTVFPIGLLGAVVSKVVTMAKNRR